MKSQLNPESDPKLHIVEFGGRGGVYQHAVALIQHLNSRGVKSVLHTASDPEFFDKSVSQCGCINWNREINRFRRLAILKDFIFVFLPHIRKIDKFAPIWVQGIFKLPLTLTLLIVLRLTGHTVMFSPHALFARGRGRFSGLLLNWCVRISNVVVVYNQRDEDQLTQRKIKTFRISLYQYIPENFKKRRSFWKSRIKMNQPLIGCLGQIREDKNMPFVVDIADAVKAHAVIVGEDLGGGKLVRKKIEASLQNHYYENRYLELADLVAVMSLLQVLVLPYKVASQSGLASIANSLSVPIVTSDTGALQEFSDISIEMSEPLEGWAKAVESLVGHKSVGKNISPDLKPLIDWIQGQS